MARKTAADLQKAKEAKQKKVLIALLPVFLLLVVWQGPKMYKELLGSEPAPEAAPAATEAAPPAAPGAPAAPAVTAAGLADSDPLPAAGEDRLLSFSRFTARDPFLRPAGYEQADPGSAELPDASTAGSALVSVNGLSETVPVEGAFPSASPVFVLVSVAESSASVGLVSGSFEGGDATVSIAVGEQVQLVADDGVSYAVTLVSVSLA